MSNQDFTTSILVDQSPDEVSRAINSPRAWWSEDIDGSTDKLNAEWNCRFQEIHRNRMKTGELIPRKGVVWLVEDNYFAFTKDKSEWIGNRIAFEISNQGNKTELTFTQYGLVPAYECYNACRDAIVGALGPCRCSRSTV